MTDEMIDGKFFKTLPQRLSTGMLEQLVVYCKDGEIHEYTATGEDLLDLARDWAFKWLELFE